VSQTIGHMSATTKQSPVGRPGWQACPAGQSQEVVQAIPVPTVPQMCPPEASWPQLQPLARPPQALGPSAGSQEIAFGGIQDSAQVRWPEVPLQTSPLQQSLPLLQEPPSGMHIGVVVEVVVVGVVVLVEVLVVGLVEKHVRGLGSRQSSVPPHPPQQSQGCPACVAASSGLTQSVWAAPRRQVPSLRGTWQILTVPSGQVIAAIALEGISAAMAVPAKSLRALRRLIEPSASDLASSSKERLVVCWLTCSPLCPKDGTLGF
jgi:hypothetical protein